MARHVNSFSELFSSSASESQIFEGLEEIIPPGVLANLAANAPIVPQPEQPLVPIPEAEPLAQPEAGPSQRRAPKNKRYSHFQLRALSDFIAVHPNPTYEQKTLLSQQIGLTMKKINKWIEKHSTPPVQSDEQLIVELISRNEELVKEIEELKTQNQILINALTAGTCPQCRGPIPHPDVQQPRVPINPSQPEFLEVSSDDSSDQEILRRDILDLPGPAHNLVGVTTEEVAGIVHRAKDEFIIMATAGYPLWISSSSDINSIYTETLNYIEYLRMSQRGSVAQYFQSEASRHSSIIRLSPITIIQILMDVEQWSPVFYSMVTNAQILEVLSPGEEESYKVQKQIMSAEFVLSTPKVPAREVQFVRYSHQHGRKLDHCGCICG
ncbi:hypothetical protein M0R45_001611 [Rubus argutus]|uniref:START domain-containing protein n=1 Tax=Rubus argutus TaxID=59490 RepID=A0AAW1VLF5_RUBAR